MATRFNRHFRRYAKATHFDLKRSNSSMRARIADYSLEGLGLVIDGTPVLREGDVVDIVVPDPHIVTAGEVVWARAESSRVRAGIKNIGQLKGFIRDFSFADTLVGLRMSGKTGVLRIENGGIMRRMYFRDGAIVHADSADDGAGIIFMLMKSGRLTRAQYDTVHNAMMKTGQKPGAVLVRLGYLRPKELLSAFKQYAEQTVLGLFSLPDGRFTFEERALGPEENMPVKLSTAGLIYRGIKGSVSPTHVMAGLPPPDSLLSRFPDSLTPFRSVEVDDAGRRIISFLEVKRTVGEILALPDIDKMELLKTLSALISMNFIETDSLAKAASPVVKSEEERSVDPKVRAMIEDMHARYQQLGFYGVLDIADTASTAAIKKAYYRAAKKFHPDMHFSLADVGLKAKLSDIFSFVYQAYATLSNGRLRREYDASAGGKPAHPRGTQEKARQQFEDGMVCFRDGNHSDAELHFAQAVYYDSKVSRYHYYYGLALAAQRRFKEAERALEKARKIEPDNPACLAELGFIHLSLGFRLRARGFFEKALALSPSNARAAEGLAALEKHEH